MDYTEVRLSGSGGQGMLLAGIILAEAAIRAGKNAVQTQSYGPEARGGASKSEVIISDGEIDYPKVTAPDLMLALTQEAFDKYAPELKSGGVLVVDSSINTNGIDSANVRVFSIPILESATHKLGRAIVANMVALGALIAASKLIPMECLEQAVLQRVPQGTEELNKRAVRTGAELITSQSS